jgi:7-cyano-7-deazaguanine synthase in queuosine biosynthesis
MKINIDYQEPTKGKFSSIKLSFEPQNENMQVCALKVSYEEAFQRVGLNYNVAFDLLLLGIITYGIDNAVSRDKYSINGWSREFEITFPVSDPILWSKEKKNIEHTLNFLTGDIWDISFQNHQVKKYYLPTKKDLKKFRANNKLNKDVNIVSLFSGGLDSFIGIIDQSEKNKNNKILLASHSDGNYPGVKSDQNNCYENLQKEYKEQLAWSRLKVSLDNVTIGDDNKNEITTRSRSMLFLSIGILYANAISNSTEVLIPENGTIAINHPLTVSRRSSCSTRTAHPYFLSILQGVLKNVGIQNPITNPYELKTKGEMAEDCENRNLLIKSMALTCSCAKSGHKTHWDNRVGTKHCGRCMPCLYRRVALHKINADNELYGIVIFNKSDKKLNQQDLLAFFDYLREDYSIADIEKNILVNGSFPLDKVKSYAHVIVNTRKEIKAWIKTKGNAKTKKMAGI